MPPQDVTSLYETCIDRVERLLAERAMTGWGLDVLFNPSKRHMDEEKRRLQSTREEIGDSSGGKRIDLESGKVVIARPNAKAEAESESDSEDAPESELEAVDEAVVDDETEDEQATG
jgi:uncharacterized protein DUF6191